MRNRVNHADVFIAVGVASVVAGVSLWSVPAGLITFGAVLVAVGIRSVRLRGA